jgi:superfamily II DNA helicase RecQ
MYTAGEQDCISEWGGGDNFRQEYHQLSELCSFFQTPVMALNATSTKKVKADITTPSSSVQCI